MPEVVVPSTDARTHAPQRTPSRIDSAGRSLAVDDATPARDRFLIGHLSKSMFVSETNTAIENSARVFGASQGHFLLLAGGFGAPGPAAAAAETALDVMASQLVNQVPWFFGLDVDFGTQLTAALEAAVARCHRAVLQATEATPADGLASGAEAGTTLTAVYVLWPRMYVVHLGDNRCYLVRDGEARLITREHTRGVAAADREGARVLTNALGAGIPQPSADVLRVGLEVGDALVLCTGGGDEAEHERVARAVLSPGSAELAAEALARDPRTSPGRAGATAVVARFPGSSPRDVAADGQHRSRAS